MNKPGTPALINAEDGDGRRTAAAVSAGSTFLRGLVLGALVGAAIAGPTIWERRQGRRGCGRSGHDPAAPSGA